MASSHFIFDFDSTVVQTEALEELAHIALAHHPDKNKRIAEIKRITDLGMEGKMPFHESLDKRIALLDAKKQHIEQLIEVLKTKLSPTFLDNIPFFEAGEGNIYIISGGCREFIVPVVEKLKIPEKYVLANTFLYDDTGKIVGVDQNNPLSQEGGKIVAIKKLKLNGSVIMIGDGMSDANVWKSGLAEHFFAYTETVVRPAVMSAAEKSVGNFDELLEELASL